MKKDLNGILTIDFNNGVNIFWIWNIKTENVWVAIKLIKFSISPENWKHLRFKKEIISKIKLDIEVTWMFSF